MLALLLLLVALAAGIAATLLTGPDAGYVLVSYGPWVVETSLAVLVIGVALWFFGVYALIRLLLGLVRLPGRLRASIETRQRERARRSFLDGLLLLLEGRWKQAELELIRHASDHDAPHLNYLGAARAAQRLGAAERREHYLRLAAEHCPADLRATLLVTQAELYRDRGDYPAMKEAAERLRELDPDHPYALALLAEAHAASGEWSLLDALLQTPAAAAALEPGRHRELRLRALRGLIAAAQAAGKLEPLKSVWQSAGDLRDDPGLRLDYARALAHLGADAEAAAVIAQALDRAWQPQLAILYGELHLSDPLTQLASVEAWLQAYGEQPELLAAAGRACLRQRLWGKAKSYLEGAIRLRPSARAYLDLARLAEATQQPEEAARCYRQGLELAAGAAGDER